MLCYANGVLLILSEAILANKAH